MDIPETPQEVMTMSAEVETMMSVREIPWHGLGEILEDAPDGAGAMKAAGLDWLVEMVPVFYKDGSKYVERPERLTRRDSDGRPLGVVGPSYEPIQNHEMFEFADALLDTGEVKFETAGSLRDGQFVWALANLDGPVRVADDDVTRYLLLSNTHNGWQAFRALVTPVRVVCMNTLQFAYKNHRSQWKIRHSGNPAQKLDEARVTLDIAYDYYDTFAEDVAALIDIEVSDHRFNSILSKVIPKGQTDRSETMRSTQRDEIRAIYHGSTVKPFTDTGWGVINALSEWELWGRAHRSKRPVAEVHADKILQGDATPMTMRAHKMLVANN